MKGAIDLRCLNERQGSGVATYTASMISAIAKDPRAREIDWIGFTSGRTKREIPDFGLPYKRHHVATPNLVLNAAMSVSSYPRASHFIQGADFIWQPNPLFFPTSSTPQIVTIHDISFRHMPEFFPYHTRAWYLRWVMRFLAVAPPNVTLLADSNHTLQDVLEYYPLWKDRIIVQAPAPPKAKDVSRVKGEKRTAIAVGTLEPRKNFIPLINAAEKLQEKYPDFELVIIGQPTSWWRKKNRVASQASAVRFTGYITDAEREAMYRQAWCLVYPSFYEGYGLPPLEAMAYSVPVVATNVSPVTEILGDAALLIDPYRATEELQAALSALLDSSTLHDQYAARGRARLEELTAAFTLDPMIHLWQSLA